MNTALFIKAIYQIQNFVEKNYFVLIFLQSYFFDEQRKFLILEFY